ncbi:MAG: alpha/beta fold hydrolase [Novosphingobium sp.]
MADNLDPAEQDGETLEYELGLPPAMFGPEGPFASFLKSADPFGLLHQNVDLAKTMFQIGMGKSTLAADPRDARFKDDAWTESPVYRRVLQSYLAMTEAVEQMIPDDLEHDQRARAELAASIVTSTLAPTNTLLGNPAAAKRAIATKGGSVAKGLKNFVDDLLHNDGMPSQVDDSGFEVGKNLAVTPGKVVHRTEMFELIHYQPAGDTVYAIPSLLIPPQIGRFYFTDLAPGRSFAEYTVAQGFNHFVISWRNPGKEHRDWGLDNYVAAALEAMEAVSAITGQPRINVISFCAGGILASLASSILAARGSDLVNTLALCVTMLNWKVEATIGAFRLPAALKLSKSQTQKKGVLTGSDLHKVFSWLRPNDLVWNYWVNNYLMGDSPAPFDILAWNKDSTNLPAKLHQDFLNIFQNNELIEPGVFKALDTPIDLGSITCDSFIVGAQTDHLTPWKACYESCGLLGGASTFALSNGGHVAALVNPPSNPKAYHTIGAGTAAGADAWLEQAVKRNGSWWEGWTKWCAERSGARVPAPRKLGSKAYPAQSDAPGSYVLQ